DQHCQAKKGEEQDHNRLDYHAGHIAAWPDRSQPVELPRHHDARYGEHPHQSPSVLVDSVQGLSENSLSVLRHQRLLLWPSCFRRAVSPYASRDLTVRRGTWRTAAIAGSGISS